MIGVDTNILVRFFTADDPAQAARASSLMAARSKDDPAYICLTVMVETWWVLTRSYGFSKADVAELFARLLNTDTIVVESSALLREVLRQVKDGADFADALIALRGLEAGCHQVRTFDRRAARTTPMTLLEARVPGQ